MKGAGTLVLLLLLAAAAGVALYLSKGGSTGLPDVGANSQSDRELFVEQAIGLRFKERPVVLAVGQDILLERIGEYLDGQFGPGGLTRRTRAYELLGLLPPGHNLRGEFIAMESGGVRGWFNPRDGAILVPGNIDESNPYDQSVLTGLLARLLLHQHAPLTIGKPADDTWLAHRGIHGAAAARVEAKFRNENAAAFELPTSAETEREAILLGLPMYVHNVAQFHLFQALDYVKATTQEDPALLAKLIAEAPETTLQIFGGDPSRINFPKLPTIDQILLEEGIGALGVQILFEWLDDYQRSTEFAAGWRGDRYGLFANGSGDHLVWMCNWETPALAQRALAVLRDAASNARDEPISPRFRFATAKGTQTVFANCGDQESLDALRATLGIQDSPPAPAP